MEIKTGMRVKIIKSDKTKKSYGVTPDMRRMVGGTYTAGSVSPLSVKSSSGSCIRIGGWNWCSLDLDVPEKLKEIKAEKFNPENLIS